MRSRMKKNFKRSTMIIKTERRQQGTVNTTNLILTKIMIMEEIMDK